MLKCSFNDSTQYILIFVHLQCLTIWRRLAAPLHDHLLPDLDYGKGDSDPGGAREHPGRLPHILLLLLVFGLLDGHRGGLVGRDGATDGAVALHQVDGGDGNRAGWDRDVLSQDFILWGRKFNFYLHL